MADLLEILNKYKDSKIAIYGLGTETERVLKEIGQDFQILGLLDIERKEDYMVSQSFHYSKPLNAR